MAEKNSRWMRVKDMENGYPFNTRKLYFMKHRRRHEQLFSKIGGCLFVDLNAIDLLLEEKRCKQPEK